MHMTCVVCEQSKLILLADLMCFFKEICHEIFYFVGKPKFRGLFLQVNLKCAKSMKLSVQKWALVLLLFIQESLYVSDYLIDWLFDYFLLFDWSDSEH